MEKREAARIDWEAGMKYREIAEKHGTTESTVKSWATRFWKSEGCKKVAKKVATKSKKLQPKVTNPKGAPKENLVPFEPGNALAVTHGGYANIVYGQLSPEQKEIYDLAGEDIEREIIQSLKIMRVREYRLLSGEEKTGVGTEKLTQLENAIVRAIDAWARLRQNQITNNVTLNVANIGQEAVQIYVPDDGREIIDADIPTEGTAGEVP
jgi:uncharacterized protein YjcR